VAASGLGARLRAEPNLSAPVLEVLADGTPVSDLAEERAEAGRTWRKVTAPSGAQGWIGADLLTAPVIEGGTPSERRGDERLRSQTLSVGERPEPAGGRAAGTGEGPAALALRYLGSPYRWGGASPAGFDCSGFVTFVYRTLGLDLPRDLSGQLAAGRPVSPNELEPGDIVFFRDTYTPGLSHAGIYLGSGEFVHAADESSGVVISRMWDRYWGTRFLAASRPGT
jgi:cell wall-associated NlpC family hydrolase